MSKYMSKMKKLRKNNWKVFDKGALLGVVGGSLIAVVIFVAFFIMGDFNTMATVDLIFSAPIIIGFVFLFMIVVNMFIGILFIILNHSEIEMVGVKKWTFYVTEITILPIVAVIAVFVLL